MSNIAEGCEPNSRREFVQFLSIANVSYGEPRAQLLTAADQDYFSATQHNEIRNDCLALSAGLADLLAYYAYFYFCSLKLLHPFFTSLHLRP